MANFLVMALIPFSLLVGLNFKLYRTLQVNFAPIWSAEAKSQYSAVYQLIISWQWHQLAAQESGKIRNGEKKKRSREKREQKIASLLILLVIVFGCCNVVSITFLCLCVGPSCFYRLWLVYVNYICTNYLSQCNTRWPTFKASSRPSENMFCGSDSMIAWRLELSKS